MYRRDVSRAAAGLAAVTAVGLPAVGGQAGVQILSQSCEIDRAHREAVVRLVLDAPPDLYTIDAFGRPRDSFQYEIDAGWSGRLTDPKLCTFDVVLRGDEVAAAGALRVRSSDFTNPDPDPLAKGWGPLLGTVPLDIDGNTLSFRARLDLLGDTDGVFAYRVFTTEYGATTSLAESHVIPLPTSVSAAGVAVGALVVGNLMWKRLRRRRSS